LIFVDGSVKNADADPVATQIFGFSSNLNQEIKSDLQNNNLSELTHLSQF
jgi:hypothetical protein